MRYQWFRSRGSFVGSGTVEAGAGAVTGQRLKLSGIRWIVADAGATTELRCEQASRPEDETCYAPASRYQPPEQPGS